MKLLITLLILLVGQSTFSQDERQFRDLFQGEFSKDISKQVNRTYKYEVNTPLYKIDLNSDHRNESVFYEFKDGESWLHFLTYKEERLKSFKLDTNGHDARIYKIRLKTISKTTLALVIYFYEGFTQYTELNSTSRLYFVTVDRNSLESMNIYKGPIFWEEKRTAQGHYHQRPNLLSFSDLNKNGTKEVIVKQGLSSRVFMYRGEGRWLSF
jgi:hypothetical protein